MSSSSLSPNANHSLSSSNITNDQFKSQKYKRNYRACLNCRVRKVKCDLGSVENPRDGKCARCLRERKDCVFVESKRGGSANVLNGKRNKIENHRITGIKISNQAAIIENKSLTNTGANEINLAVDSHSIPQAKQIKNSLGQHKMPSVSNILNSEASRKDSGDSNQDEKQIDTSSNTPNNHFSTMEGALVFLAKAAGTIAKADERDNIDARQKHEQIEARISSNNNSTEALNGETTNSSNQNATSISNILNSNSFLSTKPNQSNRAAINKPISSIPPYIRPVSSNKRMTMPAAENGYAVRPKGSNKLSSIDYIGGPNSILTEQEAEQLIFLFFTTMHPYFPYLPKFLHSPKVLSGYPILLCAILTISSRYHPFENNVGNGGVPRNIEVHDRLWLYVQRLISQTVWAEASTRSIGTIFAFLLFTEWNPRAIHWRWTDYANKADDNNETDSSINNLNTPNISSSQDEPNLAGLGAMRRSYRMAWMLIGSAVRLAQDMGFMEISSKTFLATHIAEINSVMNISRRSMLAHSLSEADLDEDEVTEEDMEEGEDDDSKILGMTEEDLKRISSEHVLKFTLAQKAQIELLQIISLGHESLYGYKAQLGSLTQRQNLSVLNIISPLINNWGKKYKQFLVPSNNKLLKNVSNLQQHLINPNSRVSKELAECIERESFIFEFHYVKLYIYSLALSPSPKAIQDRYKKKSGKPTLKLDEMSKSAKYIEQAFNSANEMLLVAHRVHKLKMLRFMPVRWLTRIVRAVAFIVKCYLTITAHKKTSNHSSSTIPTSDNFDSTILSLSLISIDEIVQSIQRAAITLRDCSPDELHLCTRYSNVLMYLCSEMKTKSKYYNNNADDDYAESEYKRQKLSEPVYNNNDEYNKSSFSQSYNINNTDLYDNSNTPNPSNTPDPSNTNSFNYEPSGYFDRTNSASNISNSESMTPSEAGNTPLQGLIGDSEVMEWFMNNRNIGLDFVGPWTEMIEQQLNLNDQFNFDNALL